jgi:hypothetical protein
MLTTMIAGMFAIAGLASVYEVKLYITIIWGGILSCLQLHFAADVACHSAFSDLAWLACTYFFLLHAEYNSRSNTISHFPDLFEV